MFADLCLSTPCKNSGTCKTANHSSTYYCDCPSGFTGSNCELSEYFLKIMPISTKMAKGDMSVAHLI